MKNAYHLIIIFLITPLFSNQLPTSQHTGLAWYLMASGLIQWRHPPMNVICPYISIHTIAINGS